MRETSVNAILASWRTRPGGIDRRLRRFGSLLLRLLLYGMSVVIAAAAVLGLALLIFGVHTFRSTIPSIALLLVSLGSGFAIAAPLWRMLIAGHRFRCFHCEADAARVQRHDDIGDDESGRSVRYTFECERCGRSDTEI